MKREEFEKVKNYNYLEYCDYLKEKYGNVKGNYFLTETCKSKNRSITRGKEGLFIHHIKENEVTLLSKYEKAIKMPFEFQHAENLVYCDYTEHLLLHIMIVREYLTEEYFKETYEVVGICGILYYIVPSINNYFSGVKPTTSWELKAFELVDKGVFEELKKKAWGAINDNSLIMKSTLKKIAENVLLF